jgi:hypothetical protein
MVRKGRSSCQESLPNFKGVDDEGRGLPWFWVNGPLLEKGHPQGVPLQTFVVLLDALARGGTILARVTSDNPSILLFRDDCLISRIFTFSIQKSEAQKKRKNLNCTENFVVPNLNAVLEMVSASASRER